MKFSVIVCTYNASEKELLFTLSSIVKQSIKEFEIIIADDGSKNNHVTLINEYFRNNDFEEYKIVQNSANQGTVKNLISGLRVATGEYVKPIGAGDALENSDVLLNVYTTMKENKAKCLFTDMKVFTYTSKERIFLNNISIPRFKKCYAGGYSSKKAIENVVVFNDQISGASFFYDTLYVLELFEFIQSKVIYMEDLVQYIVLLSGEKIFYLNMPCVLYEIGAGISTLKNNKNNEKMRNDKKAFLNLVYQKFPNNSYVQRRKKIELIEDMYSNKFIKGILKVVREPKWIYFRLIRRK